MDPTSHLANYDVVTHGRGIHIGDHYLAQTLSGDRYINKVNYTEGSKFEVSKSNDRIIIAGNNVKKVTPCACGYLDISWLPLAANTYHVSPDISDYVLVDVPIVVADFPNRNMDGFTYKELVTFRSIVGRTSYQSFIGKPVHQDHDNLDPTRAKGIIFDATLTKFMDQWHVKILKGFDRSKDARLAKLVQQKNRIGHSMGALVERTECSLPWCRFSSDGRVTCDHIRGGQGKGEIIKGHLAYENMKDFYYVESSSVEDPAYPIALSTHIWGI